MQLERKRCLMDDFFNFFFYFKKEKIKMIQKKKSTQKKNTYTNSKLVNYNNIIRNL